MTPTSELIITVKDEELVEGKANEKQQSKVMETVLGDFQILQIFPSEGTEPANVKMSSGVVNFKG